MSKEISTVTHGFNVSLAEEYGIDCAIMIGHLVYWVEYNQRLSRNFYEERTWMYQTQKELAAHFPYWNEDQIYRIMKKLVDKQIIKKGNFNKCSYDQTLWYSFINEELFIKSYQEKSTIPQNRGIESPIVRNQKHEIAEPIPHTKTDTKTDIKKRKNEDSFLPFSNFEEKIRNLLKSYEPDESIIKLALKETPEIIEQALIAADQFCTKKKIEDKLPIINKAIYEKWKPTLNDEANISKNKEFIDIYKEYDGKISKTGWKFDIYTKYVEFSFATQNKIFEYSDKNFVDNVHAMLVSQGFV